MQRKPIRMTTIVGGGGDEILVVLCDDSTIWSYEQNEDGDAVWERLPNIPGIEDDAPQRQPE